MKQTKLLIVAAVTAYCAAASAETLNIKEGSVTYMFPAAQTGEMEFGAGNTLTVMGREFALGENYQIWVDDSEVEDNVVAVTYDGASAQVAVAGNVAQYVSATIDGAKVSLTQSEFVSDQNCGEISYRLSGNSTSGSFALTGSYKATIELAGLTLTSTSGAALDIQDGKRIALRLAAGTVNTLTDAASGSQKGCIVCKGHLEFKGSGSLTVTGKTSHAIYAKEYIQLSNSDITVAGAVKDGLNCNQYFLMKSGSLKIDKVGDDGIQVSYKDATDREAEDTGAITVSGGKLTVNVSAEAAKGLKCEGDMVINGGELDITVTGNGVWDDAKSKTKASAALASDRNLTIADGVLNLKATGSGGKGINNDGTLTIDGGTLTITTSGGILAYVNGSLSHNYTGNTDRIDSDMKSSPKGIKTDGNVEINGGTITVNTTGNGGEGIESKSILTVNDGTIYVKSSDDAINSSGHMYIKGGNITVISTGNDGLDSNGNLYIQGGYTMAFGARAPECGIDANEEEGYTVVFTGGTLLAVGGGNSVPSASSGTTQPFVKGSGSVASNAQITLSDSSGTQLATFTVPSAYTPSSGGGMGPGGMGSGGSIVITCPGMTKGSKYTLKNGNSTSSLTAATSGSSR